MRKHLAHYAPSSAETISVFPVWQRDYLAVFVPDLTAPFRLAESGGVAALHSTTRILSDIDINDCSLAFAKGYHRLVSTVECSILRTFGLWI